MGRAFWMAVAGCLCLCMAGCEPNKNKKVDTSVAWVNGEAISFHEFFTELQNRYQENIGGSTPKQEMMDTLKKSVLSDLIRERLLLQAAGRRGLSVPEEVLDARLEALNEERLPPGPGGPPQEDEKDPEDLARERRTLRRRLMIEALFNQLSEKVPEPSEGEVRKYYEDHPQEFFVPETVHLRQIVVHDGALAKALLKRIRKGEDFQELATQYSVAPEKDNAGDIGFLQLQDLPDPLGKAVFSTSPGKVAPLVETNHGYHILQVVERIPYHMASLEEAGGGIRKTLLDRERETYYAEWIDALIKKSDVRVHLSLRDLVAPDPSSGPIPPEGETGNEAPESKED